MYRHFEEIFYKWIKQGKLKLWRASCICLQVARQTSWILWLISNTVEGSQVLISQKILNFSVIYLQFWVYGSWDSMFPISMSPTANLWVQKPILMTSLRLTEIKTLHPSARDAGCAGNKITDFYCTILYGQFCYWKHFRLWCLVLQCFIWGQRTWLGVSSPQRIDSLSTHESNMRENLVNHENLFAI